MKLLQSGLDTVECAYYLVQLRSDVFDFTALAMQREALRAAKRRDPHVVTLGSKEYLLGRGGTASGYPLVLANPDQTIQCGEFISPSFFVTYRSDALWHKGASRLHADFCDWAREVGFVVSERERLSRVDFAFDVHLPVVDFDEDCFVTQASKDRKYRKDRRAQTFSFGEGDIVVRVYDKTAEISESSDKTWFYDLWGGVSEDVWRIEFQVRKKVLKRFGLRTFDALFSGYGDVLRYLVNDHTTLRIRGEDSNRSRWPIHPLWKMLREEIDRLPAQGVVREIDPEAQLREQLMRNAIAVEGYVKRAAAIECVRRRGELLSHERAMAEFMVFVRCVHDPLTWRRDVLSRADEIRLGQR